ncbi:MAG TPA: chemotaxis protein CheB [Ideonella sp.]|uniref:chemotaxis protein CheB n=1 Tax=Ideonella sp. TaxID=1929293 RepID=UPI002B7C6F9E|nr:chemotaxis protein CheB [Ideonella sp.]HSI49464.1 chemotaxis protein CheB [Ideonella sp.]
MHNARLVVIGASLGGVAALREICRGLPEDFGAAIGVVLHVGAYRSVLPALLSSAGPLPAVHAEDGAPLQKGRIHVAPPDQHMRVEGDVLRLLRGPKEHHSRPAIDPLFRSAALSFGARTIGLVLTGMLDDGTPGMQAIKDLGGTCVVQDPSEAEAPSMPLSVLRHVAVDHCVPVREMAPLLCKLIDQPVEESPVPMPQRDRTVHEEAVLLGQGDVIAHLRAIGQPSTFACPDCGGTLWQLAGTSPQRFRCHTGHAFTLETLRASQSLSTDEALWSSIRALQEKRELVLQAEKAAAAQGNTRLASALASEAATLHDHTSALRGLVQGIGEITTARCE